MKEIERSSNITQLKPGQTVDIIMKQDQRSGKLTRGVIRDILTNSAHHPHGKSMTTKKPSKYKESCSDRSIKPFR